MIDLMVIVIFGIYLLGGILWYKYQDCGFYVFYFSQCQWDHANNFRWNYLFGGWHKYPAYVQTPNGYIPFTLWSSKEYPTSTIKSNYNKLDDLKEVYRTRAKPKFYFSFRRA